MAPAPIPASLTTTITRAPLTNPMPAMIALPGTLVAGSGSSMPQ